MFLQKKYWWSKVYLIIFIFVAASGGQDITPRGTVKGKIIDGRSKAPLAGANVQVVNTLKGTASDTGGSFEIKGLEVGTYSLEFSYIGYQTRTRTDIIVRPERITTTYIELHALTLESETIEVTAGFFSQAADQPVSTTSYAAEEIRRAPGSAGDVSRILMTLPSVAKVNDQSNSLIIRGGSPIENAFYLDNIEIPNINHYPTQGSSGGPIGMVNVDFIKDVNFYTGGFGAAYGDRLSSIMELNYREGNRDEFDGQLDLNFAGFGGAAEGPMFGAKGSWMVSLRRSYLDLLVDAINIGTSVAPRYGDYQGKFVLDLDSHNQIGLLGLWGDDHIRSDKEIAEENDMIVYGNQDITQRTTGLNWRHLWGSRGYSNTSLSYTMVRYNEDFFETSSNIHLIKNRSLEQQYKFRNVNRWHVNKKNSIEFGFDAKRIHKEYDNFFSAYTDAHGQVVPRSNFDKLLQANTLGTFISYIATPLQKMTTTAGLRMDYFSYTGDFHFSPRFSVSYQLTERFEIHGATGRYYQNLPAILLVQNDKHKNLNPPSATHFILGSHYLLEPDTRITLEAYHKSYKNFPLDPQQPGLFLVDELFYRYGFFFNHEQMNDAGRAISQGVEVTIQKKLARDFYGLASATWFKTRYRGSDHIWRNRVFDNRYIISAEGGYKPDNKWEFSLRWIYAGGSPYTPFDSEQSADLNRAVLDDGQINQRRYPDYHSLNIRFDRRFHYNASNLVFYLSVWNVYNQQNIATYFWNEKENKQDVIYQWGFLPIFGLEYEF